MDYKIRRQKIFSYDKPAASTFVVQSILCIISQNSVIISFTLSLTIETLFRGYDRTVGKFFYC